VAVKTFNQRLRSPKQVRLSSGDSVTLPAGSLMKCVQIKYLPNGHTFRGYDETLWVVAYTQLGLAIMDRTDIDWEVP
jgi:hypothetical protein